jgi:nucleoside-diphosphate-sugar epimerase
MRRVLVTGGTGLIGLEVVRQLCAAGYRPRVLIRRPHRGALLRSHDIEPVAGDLAVPESLDRAVEGVDTVIHLGGRATFERYSRLAPTLVDGTAYLADTAARAGVEHLVFASSALVYGSSVMPIDRDTPVDPQNGYGLAKVEAERQLAGVSRRRGLTVGSLRLPHVYGPHSILFQQVRRGFAAFPGSMTNPYSHLHVDDAARALIAAAQTRWAGTAPIADRYNATWEEFFEVLRAYVPRLTVIRLPQTLGYAGAAVIEPLLSGRRRTTLYSTGTVIGFNLALPIDSDETWRELGIVPTYPTIAEGVPATLDGYVHFLWRHPAWDQRRS